MLPAAYQAPAAAVLIAGGFLSCFFGYRLFKVVLGMFGFIVGVLAASSFFGPAETTPMLIGAIVGGIVGAGVLLAAYFVGVALVGAGIGALLVNVIWTQIEGDPHPAVVILLFGGRRGGRHVAAALRDHHRHRVRGRLDAVDRRAGVDGRWWSAARRDLRQSVGGAIR